MLVLDLIGVAVFAASGASAAVAKRLDLFGVVFIGMVTALGGGVVRDVVIGAVPPLAFTDWEYVTTAAVTSLAMFWLHPQVDRLRRTMLVLDAAGLGLFSVVGALKGVDHGVPMVGAILVGMITGIGGGVLRDVLTKEIPVVLHREIYASASLLGAAVIVASTHFGLAKQVPMTIAIVLVFGLRLLSLYRRWSAPTPRVGSTSG
ncbi:trimeric intracellular cation channel family protein [Phytomonospora endophytica]|uniref:Putative membrane protein YeiH n=1 Tax=Phytomonospora endophytica TaxID=714109 RepID=A0A841FNQ8_9ACTN|nr:trimeric intracellular cation channel family protein [Phytomonospora endophytica]MBB6034857.1 putative membrane protein YeiH [Phytomonospora endophytica]GIG70560.1 membrane protein [Phytomonospora endophytica]